MKKWISLLASSSVLLVSALVFATSPELVSVEQLPKLSQEAQHAQGSIRLSALYSRSHYRKTELNDELSSKIFERYLQMLDYNKQLFTQEDLAEFETYRTQLDEALVSGRLDAFYAIYHVSQIRRFERFTYAIALLKKPFNFDVDESYEFDRSELPWAKNTKELDEIWRKRVKNDALNLKMAGKKAEKITELLTKRYNNALKRMLKTESEDVFQAAMNAFSRTIEPHTSYLSPRNAERFQMDMNLSLEGIGAVLQAEDDYTVIKSLVVGGPAEGSGALKPEDKIIGVAQGEEAMVDVIGWRLDDVVELIKGPKGTEVRLQILPAKAGDNGKTKIVSIIRDKIRLEDRAAKSEVIEMDGKKIGVIDIPSFYNKLSQNVAVELEKLKQAKVEGVVVDLRGNGGGALTEATNLTGLFISSGPVVQVRDADGSIEVKEDDNSSVAYAGPLVVLVNRYSASASEIFAAAMQDYGRAVIIGEQTFGKGTVQQHRPLKKWHDLYEKPIGNVQYTIAKFYRINGGSTQHKGVVPDILFPSSVPAEETGESMEKNALPWDSINAVDYKELGAYEDLIKVLDKEHQQRIVKDPEFQYVLDDIRYYKQESKSRTVSLREKDRIAKRDEAESKELARYNERLQRMGKEAVKSLDDIPDDFDYPDAYLDEAARITLQLAMLKKECISVACK